MTRLTIAEGRELLGKQAESMTDAEVEALIDELRSGARLMLRLCAERRSADAGRGSR